MWKFWVLGRGELICGAGVHVAFDGGVEGCVVWDVNVHHGGIQVCVPVPVCVWCVLVCKRVCVC